MTVATTVAGIQTVNATISGVTSAPTTMPASLTTASLPFAWTIPGPCEWQNNSANWGYQFRTYLIRFYVLPNAQGIPADQGYQAAESLIEAVGRAYMADTTFGGVVNTVRGEMGFAPITDGGIRADMTWGGGETQYWGFEFQIIVKGEETW